MVSAQKNRDLLARQELASGLHLLPPLTDLSRRGGAGGAELLDGDRGDEVAEGGSFGFVGAGQERSDDAAGGGVAGADDVDGAGDRMRDNERCLSRGLSDENSLLAQRAVSWPSSF